MRFSKKVADEVFVKCSRHCCICGRFSHKMQLHHIKAVADGGDNTADNCIPLCLDCHANVKADNPKHSLGRTYTENELKGHRDKCYAKYGIKVEPTIKDDSQEIILNWVDNIIDPKDDKMIWGYSTLDKMCPLTHGNITLVSGYAFSGKSIYTQHIVRKNLLKKRNIVYVNLKDSDDTILNNILSSETMIALNNIQNNTLSADEWQRISLALTHLNIERLKLFANNSSTQIAEFILSIAKDNNTDLIVIDDFDGLMLKQEEIESFMYRLKNIINLTGVSVIILYNLSNNVKRMDKRPVLSDFNSDNIYRFCDYIHFVYKNDTNEIYLVNADVEIIVQKAKGINNTLSIETKYIPNIPDLIETVPYEE